MHKLVGALTMSQSQKYFKNIGHTLRYEKTHSLFNFPAFGLRQPDYEVCGQNMVHGTQNPNKATDLPNYNKQNNITSYLPRS